MARGRKLIKTIEIEEKTVRAAAEEFYINNKAKRLAPATQEGYKIYVECFVRWIGEDTYVSDLTEKKLDEYMIYQEEKGNKPVSIATTMRHIRRFIKFCGSREYMGKLEVSIPKYETELKEPYTDEEMKALLAKPANDNWVEFRCWAMVNYFYATGQRLSTVLNIKVKDVDLKNGTVKLVWNKDKQQKQMPLSSAIVQVLTEYIYLSGLEAEDYLFPEYEGGQLQKRSAEGSIERYNKSRGVNKTSIHLFRHTFAKDYIVNGGNPAKLQKLLNHKTIQMTMHYVNLYGEDISSDLDAFNPLDNFKRNTHITIKRKRVG